MDGMTSMTFKNKIAVLDRTVLKLIAIIAMLIDHIGYVLYPEIKFLRWIGRIAFPLFVYQLVEGYEKTSNLKNYFKRLILFAIISEIPFDLALFGVPFCWNHQNVYFELVLCLLALVLLDKTKDLSPIVRWAGIFMACLTSILLRADYDAFGILLAILFYLFKDNFVIHAIGMAVLSYVFSSTTQLFCLFSLPFIVMYNDKLKAYKLSKPIQFAFYVFYPLHILLIYIIKTIIA